MRTTNHGVNPLASPECDLLLSYRRGCRYFELLRRENPDGSGEPNVASAIVSFSKKSPGRRAIEHLALEAKLPEEVLIADAKFAAAVETIVRGCGKENERTLRVLFDPEYPQARDAILKLSRTADTRQRYRIEGVLAGTMRSVAPASTDFHHVYDTVAFKEVTSRLWRARGAIQKLNSSLRGNCCAETTCECRRLARLCREAAVQLRRFVVSRTEVKPIPAKLSKERVIPVLRCRRIRGQVVGIARLALALTIKSVWDYPEMQRRGITSSAEERIRTLEELRTIVAAADAVLLMPHDGTTDPIA